jgi:hypothetical protein
MDGWMDGCKKGLANAYSNKKRESTVKNTHAIIFHSSFYLSSFLSFSKKHSDTRQSLFTQTQKPLCYWLDKNTVDWEI